VWELTDAGRRAVAEAVGVNATDAGSA